MSLPGGGAQERGGTDPLGRGHAGEGWHLNPPRVRVMRVAAPAVAVLLLAGSVAVFAGGHRLAAAFLALVALAIGLMPWGRRSRPPSSRPVTATVGPRTGLLLPLRPTPLTVVAALLCILAAFLLIVGNLLGVALDRGSWLPAVAALVPFAVAAFVCAVAAGALLERRQAHRGLLLAPDAVVLCTHTSHSVPWEDIARVRAHWTRPLWGTISPGRQVANWLTVELTATAADPSRRTTIQAFSRGGGPSVRAESLAVDPHEALELLEHHLTHLADRANLAVPGRGNG